MTRPRCPRVPPVRGFTLLEMVVVIAILAVLATVAIRAVDGRVDQSRYEATQRQLQEIEDAVLGPQNVRQADGTLSPSGFVSDIGRLPLAMPALAPDGSGLVNGDGAQAYQPSELWSNPNGLQAFALVQMTELDATELNGGTLTSPQEIFVPCGWRGPYLRMSPGVTVLKDGWGNFFDLMKPNRTAAIPATSGGANVEASILRSRGLDAAIDSTLPSSDYRDDLYSAFKTIEFLAYPTTPLIDRCAATIDGAIHIRDTNGDIADPVASDGAKVIVKYFGPDPATGGAKSIKVELSVTGGGLHFLLNDGAITAGTRLLRAYQVKDDGSTMKKSAIVRINLAAGGNSQDFILK